MRNKLKILFIAFIFSFAANAQDIYQGDLQINAGIDLLTSPSLTPLTNIENRIRGDADFNYFLQDRFSLGVGFDYSTQLNRTGFSPGIRYYWLDQAFFRAKLNIAMDFNDFDVSTGLGYNYMFSDNWGLESNLDYFIKSEKAAFRMGIAVFI